MPKGIAKNGKRQCKPRVEHIVRICEICGKERRYPPSAIRQREERGGVNIRFCSQACSAIGLQNPKSRVKLSCLQCGKEFERYIRHLKGQNYCSVGCKNAAKRVDGAKWRNPEQIKVYMQEYENKNRVRINELSREWTSKNREKRLIVQQKYRDTHKNEIRTLYHIRKTRSDEGSFAAEDWQEMKQRYNFTCLCCGRKEPEITLTIDHIQPLAWGGTHCKENIQPLCGSCNSSKNAKTIDYRPKVQSA